MRKQLLALLAVLASASLAFADTTWISTSSSLFSSTANWNNGLPSTGPQLAIFADSATIQHNLDLAGTARVCFGIRFDLFSGGAGFNLSSSAAPGPGVITRGGGTVNGIVNNDDSTQNFNVPWKLTDGAGLPGAQGSKVQQFVTAAAGNIVFKGTNQANAPWCINLNGMSNLTFNGSFNTTVGSATTAGGIVNTNSAISGIRKQDSGTLTLAGTAPNTYNGLTILDAGEIVAAKNSAFGTGGMLLNGGTLRTGGFSHSQGTLNLQGSATMDLGAGASAMSFANSSALAWNETSILDILNWTVGTDSLRFGTDATGLTTAQLGQIRFLDLEGSPTAQIDLDGYLTPAAIPEPSTVALAVLGGLGLLIARFRRS